MLIKTRKRQLRRACKACVQPAFTFLILAWGVASVALCVAALGFADGSLSAKYPAF